MPSLPSVDPVAAGRLFLGGLLLLELAAAIRYLVVGLYRVRHIDRIRLVDVTSTPVPLPGLLRRLEEPLLHLGFRRLGELELHGILERRPFHFWYYLGPEPTVVADICDEWRRVAFGTQWPDTAQLSTRFPTPDTHEKGDIRVQAGGPTVEDAYRHHLETVPVFGARHGEPLRITSIAAVLDAEERQRPKLRAIADPGWTAILGLGAMIGLSIVATAGTLISMF